MLSSLERNAVERGIRLSGQRRVIARLLSGADDHPDVEELYRRASRVDAGISLATVYRTLRLFEEAGLVARHDAGDGRARYRGLRGGPGAGAADPLAPAALVGRPLPPRPAPAAAWGRTRH